MEEIYIINTLNWKKSTLLTLKNGRDIINTKKWKRSTLLTYSKNSKMDAYLGIPRQMATLEFQDGCLPWNSKINAYPGIPRWMPTLECLPDNFKMTNQPHLVLLSYVQLIGLDFLVYAFTKPGHTSISELLGSTWKYLSQKKISP